MGKRFRILLRIALITVLLVLCMPPMSSKAAPDNDIYSYGSWIQGTDAYENFYEAANGYEGTYSVSEEEEGFLASTIGQFIHFLGTLVAGNLSSGAVNLSIEGIVMGKMRQPSVNGNEPISLTTLDLSEGNIYGTAGAMVYSVLRGFVYTGLFLYFFYLLIQQVLGNGARSREELKNGVYGILLSFLLIYLMPHIVDFTCYARDVFSYYVMNALTDLSGGGAESLLELLDEAYTQQKANGQPVFAAGFLFTAAVGATFIYLKDYISIAAQETILLGLFPVVNVLGVKRKKLMADWAGMFFTNMFIPCIDVLCLMMPYLMLTTARTLGIEGEIAVSYVLVIMVWTSIAARNAVTKLLGNVTGTPAGRGIAGLGGMALMAARMLGGTGRGRKDSGESAVVDWGEEAAELKSRAEMMNSQASEIARNLPDVEDINKKAAEGMDERIPKENEQYEYDSTGSVDMDSEEGEEIGSYSEEISGEGLSEKGMTEGLAEEPYMEEIASVDENRQPDEQVPFSGMTETESFEEHRQNNLAALEQEQGYMQSEQENLYKLQSEGSALEDRMIAKRNEIGFQESALAREREAERLSENPDDIQKTRNKQMRLMHEMTGRKEELLSMQNEHHANNEKIRILQDSITDRKTRIEARQSAESSFAQIAKTNGRDGTVYRNRGDYLRAAETKQEQAKRALTAAKKRQEMHREDLAKLSPDTARKVAEIQKKNARHKAYKDLAASTVKDIVVAGAVLTAGSGMMALNAYGGEGKSKSDAMTGVTLGYLGASVGTTKVGEIAGGATKIQKAANAVIDTGDRHRKQPDKRKKDIFGAQKGYERERTQGKEDGREKDIIAEMQKNTADNFKRKYGDR